MATVIALVVLFHLVALGLVLRLARTSVLLVDEQGRPLKARPWRVRVVGESRPSSQAGTLRP